MIKFKVNMSGIRTSIRAECEKASHLLAQEVKKDTDPFVPALTGSFSESVIVDGNEVIYPGPYARYLYHGKLWIYPGTGSPNAPKAESKVPTNKDLKFSKKPHPQAQAAWFEASKAQNLEKWERVAEKAVKKYV